jgi:predicted MPP superfamily phosphohydrolase
MSASERIIPNRSPLYNFIRRLNFYVAVTLAITISVCGIRGATRLPVVKNVEIPLTGLPLSMDRLSIVMLSDIHIGPTVGRSKVQPTVNIVNELKADIVALIGDLTDVTVEQGRLAALPLADIKARLGKYFVTGNHEYHTGDVRNWMDFVNKELGFTVLHNSHVNVTTDRHGAYFCLAGTDDIGATLLQDVDHGMDLDKAVESCDPSQPIILLAHQPRAAKLALNSKYNIQLVLSGHTHGGQTFPILLYTYMVNPFFTGLYRDGNGYVYVTQGTVYWGIPMRTFSEAEITRVFLRSAETVVESSL